MKTKKEIENYINKKIEFKLKDYNRTKNKYKTDYYLKPFNDFIKRQQLNQNINFYFFNLKNEIKKEIILNPHLYIKDLDLTQKNNIRQLKTIINYKTLNLNRNFISYNTQDLNKNQLRVYTILFYLKYYKKINSIMKQSLKEITFQLIRNKFINTLKNGY